MNIGDDDPDNSDVYKETMEHSPNASEIISLASSISDKQRSSFSKNNPDQSDLSENDVDADEEKNEGWIDALENSDIIDDPVRMYLREIGRVGLLKAAEESSLARHLESLRFLERLDKEYADSEIQPVRSWMYINRALNYLVSQGELLNAIGKSAQIERDSWTVKDLFLESSDIRIAVDAELPEEKLNFLSEILNI